MIVTSVQIKTAKTQKHLYCPVFTRSAVVHDTMGYRTFLFFCRESPHWNNTKSIRDTKQDYIFC